jgi:hypothetical protein
MQRERTGLKVMKQILVDRRDSLVSDLTSVFTAAPEFTVLAGREETGTVGDDVLVSDEITRGMHDVLLGHDPPGTGGPGRAPPPTACCTPPFPGWSTLGDRVIRMRADVDTRELISAWELGARGHDDETVAHHAVPLRTDVR